MEQLPSIDVSFASASIINRLLWSTSEDPLESNHHPIRIQLDEPPLEITRRPRWIHREANWPAYQEIMQGKCRDHDPANVTALTEIIFQAASDSIPRTSPIPGKKALHWWSPVTKEATRSRWKALRAAKRLPDKHPDKESALKLYRAKRMECRDTIKKAKKDSWENFIDSINPS